MKNFATAFAQTSAQAPLEFESLRTSNWRLAQDLGLPNQRLEKWKYNRIRELQKDYQAAEFINLADLNAFGAFIKNSTTLDELSASQLLHLVENSALNLIFIDGFLQEQLSNNHSHIKVQSAVPDLSMSKIENQNYPSLSLVQEQNQLEPLHLALLHNFYRISLEKTPKAPVVILHLNTERQNQVSSSAWELEIAQGVAGEIIELELGSATNLNLILRSLKLAENTNLTMTLYNSTPKEAATHSLTHVKQGQNANFDLHHFNLSEGWTRSDLGCELLAEGAQAKASGVFFGKQNGELDVHFQAKHLAGKSQSQQLYKFILDDRATGIFNSGVFVARDSQKIDSVQRSANLLLSNRAKMNAKPELEIYADDVKCAHGASTGSLDKEAIFALRSRGLSKEDAVSLLTLAFANQVLEEIKNPQLRSLAQKKIYQDIGAMAEIFAEDLQ